MIADDHGVVRRGLRGVLESGGGFDVVAEAGDLETARRYARAHRPDVLVLDLNMPGGSSLDAIPEIRAENPDTQIVVLTMQDQPEAARRALGAGALGYVLKEAAEAELFLSVRTVENHRANVQAKLGLGTRAELVRYALDRGMLGT